MILQFYNKIKALSKALIEWRCPSKEDCDCWHQQGHHIGHWAPPSLDLSRSISTTGALLSRNPLARFAGVARIRGRSLSTLSVALPPMVGTLRMEVSNQNKRRMDIYLKRTDRTIYEAKQDDETRWINIMNYTNVSVFIKWKGRTYVKLRDLITSNTTSVRNRNLDLIQHGVIVRKGERLVVCGLYLQISVWKGGVG